MEATPAIATATLDTNVFPAEPLVQRARLVGIDVAAITVSHREVEGSTLQEEVAALQSIAETAVYGESRFGEAVFASEDDGLCLERALAVVSNGSFPRTANRDTLSNGERRQLRDAMTLCAHVRSGRHVLVSNDRRAFVNDGRR